MLLKSVAFPVAPLKKKKKIFDAFENSSLKRQRIKTGTQEKLSEAL